MPWSYPDNVPAVAEGWTAAEQRRCTLAAQAVLESGGSEEQAIYACIAAAGKRTMKIKTFGGNIEFKANGENGEFRAVFSRFNVIDHDGEVTLPGAFIEGQKVRIAYWGHRWGDLPVGRGEIHQDAEKAWVDGRFFLETEGGRETHQTVKELAELQEWSYGFDVIEGEKGQFAGQEVYFLRKLDVAEVSPVMLGAGIGTETVSIKGLSMADAGDMQQLHDLLVKLGAKCEHAKSGKHGEGDPEDEAGTARGAGKSSGPSSSTLASRIALDLLEYDG